MKKLPVLAAAVLALTLSVTACGGSDDKKGAAKPAGGGAAAAPKTIQPSQLNPGNAGGNGAAGGAKGTGSLTPAQKKSYQKLVKVAACMRKKGHTVDDPKPGDFGVAPKNVTNPDKANQDSMACAKQANGGG
ncbi:hypothetical protein [Actinomadura xylanilytica]|uniref:hypothetical protein n=1 Tax=Actinomadura xylanilytica TaxID=887459 RepID=UPI00255A8D45|nr:hypothetical protein [Actinomadura xylanilytica]MDL4772852.1 hypothetical protein [Actinomadura xylanilytica]